MLSDTEREKLKIFGFLVVKNVVTPQEIQIMRDEIDPRGKEAARYVRFESKEIGAGGRQLNVFGASTPFLASVVEDDRLAGAAVKMFGELAWPSVGAHQFVGDSGWHYDRGSFDARGSNFILYMEPVRGDSGTLRVVPGSHKQALS